MAKVATLDIVKHDGEVYVKEARKAEVGEKVMIDKPAFLYNHIGRNEVLTVAALEVTNDKDNTEVIAVKERGKGRYYHSEYSVLVPLKPGAKVTVDGVEYEVSDRKARDGDYVVIHDRDNEDEPYNNGDVLQVFRRGSSYGLYVMLDGEEVYVLNEECLTLIPVAKSNENQTKEGDDMTDVIIHEGVKYRMVNREVRKGDKYIVCTTNEYWSFTKGKVYPVIEVKDGDALTTDDDGDINMSLTSDEYAVLEPIPQSIDERISELERQLAEAKAEKERQEAEAQRLKVGEYAVVTCDKDIEGNKREDVSIGDVYLIKKDDRSYIPFKAHKLGGSDFNWFREDALRRATPEEVAEAKAALAEEQARKAEEAKWAKIGRKVGEFKAGDLVMWTSSINGEPRYREIVRPHRTKENHFVFTNGEHMPAEKLTLIVPVEQRFDRQINEM